jgi:carbonic anhydrase
VSSHAASPAGPPPATVLAALEAGNARFVAGAAQHPAQDAAHREALTGGQKPEAIILSCSDSRVPPEIVFDRGLGELFVVRVAGNVLGVATMASIEYAVEHLGCSLIVVMGHESCGAVKTALTVAPDDAGSFDLGSLVAAIRPHVKDVKEAALADPTLAPAVKANVNGVCGQLLRSPIVREHVERGAVKIVPALYHLGSGEVDFWDAAPQRVASRGAASH